MLLNINVTPFTTHYNILWYYSCTLVNIIIIVYSSICCVFCDKCIAEV